MRFIFLACLCLPFTACGPVTAQDGPANDPTAEAPSQTSRSRVAAVPESAKPLVAAARDRLDARVRYDGRYVGLDYPGGDVPANIGV